MQHDDRVSESPSAFCDGALSSPASGGGLPPEILWHGAEPAKPDFSPTSQSLAFALDGRRSDRPGVVDRDIYVAMNAHVTAVDFRIPAAPSGRAWRRFVDTGRPSPEDILEEGRGPRVPVNEPYRLKPTRRSSLSRNDTDKWAFLSAETVR